MFASEKGRFFRPYGPGGLSSWGAGQARTVTDIRTFGSAWGARLGHPRGSDGQSNVFLRTVQRTVSRLISLSLRTDGP